MSSPLKRKVTFDPRVTGVAILSICDYSETEINDTWFSDAEMGKLTRRAMKVIDRLERSSTSKKYCMRGLEGHSRLGYMSKKKNRLAALDAVLGEQEWQRKMNKSEECINQQAIANAYTQIASSCQMWAQAIGLQDQRATEAYLSEEEDRDEDTECLEHPSLESSYSKLSSLEIEIRTKADVCSEAYYLIRAPAA